MKIRGIAGGSKKVRVVDSILEQFLDARVSREDTSLAAMDRRIQAAMAGRRSEELRAALERDLETCEREMKEAQP